MADFIGSRISLISRSDIRYVGILHDIDSEKSTVALEQVTSYGTEGRKGNAAEEIPGSDTVYDFIVFRGSDVKDLRIETDEEPKETAPPPVPNDPAIVGTTAPPGAQRSNFQQQQGGQQFGANQPGGPPGQFPPNMPPMGPGGYYQQFVGNGRGFYGQPPYMGGYPPQGFGPGPGPYPPYGMMPPGGPGAPGAPVGPPGGPAGRGMPSMQPGPAGRGGPVQEGGRGGPSPPPQNRQQPQAGAGQDKAAPSQDGQQPPPPLESKPDIATALAAPVPATATEANSKATPTVPKGVVPAVPAVSPLPASASVAQQEQKTTAKPTGSEKTKAADNGADAVNELQKKVQEMRVTNGAQAAGSNFNASNRGQYSGPRGGGGSGRGGRGNFRGYNAHHQQPRRVEIPTTDYDFTAANAKFEKVAKSEASDGAATATADGATSTESVTSSNENVKESTNGSSSPTASSSKDASIIPPAPTDGFYNRGKSFFDNISCENKERAELKEGERPRGGAQWRGEEVKRNIETFGQSSVDGNYVGGRRGGGWRGGRARGNMNYNRGRRGGGRGGYHSSSQQQGNTGAPQAGTH